MSILLFSAGAVAFLAGVAMIGFGIPINEFSFGNTLIVAGTTSAVGGLIVVGLGAAVAHLQRIGDALATRTPVRPGRPLDMFETAAGGRAPAASARIPFPARPKTEASVREPHSAELRPEMPPPAAMPFKDYPPESFAPTLPNPDEPPVTVEDEVSLSPRHPMAPAAPPPAGFDEPARGASPFRSDNSEVDEPREEPPTPDISWRAPPPASPAPARQPQNTYFDAMWPAEAKSTEAKSAEAKPAETAADQRPLADEDVAQPTIDWPRREASSAPAKPAEPDEFAKPPELEPRAVAILKSGVVDGMGYTLYVDGSIEAELPQGTLRFASINELRGHLEKTS